MTNLAYKAIRKAARLIERNKQRYNFFNGRAPTDEHNSACVLSWIGYFLGEESLMGGGFAAQIAERLTGLFGSPAWSTFYQRMDDFGVGDWRENHRLAAKALRLYADTYYKKEVKVRKTG